ncbi:endonuclease SmrB [Alkalimonas mucilaginosa]|uniref:Ribosome rescue factor SmrB n=1 Tax=Alkalimonas mucilaginosa TaxID=3057676 RepID=A0ABU7JB86_9GAMM|nr:endonuclease SmrB [Alkalimonas sp. MEB004]MEE2022949.1 endonuclease SmrB [Alkalimonas sp. MEB004]
MPRKNQISPEESQLFRELVADTSPLVQDKKWHHSTPVAAKTKAKARLPAKEQALFYFSDQYEGYVSTDGAQSYTAPEEDALLTRALKRGQIQPQVTLDLHGMTQQQAKLELTSLLHWCELQQLHCACIVHGKGLGILARKVPNWLIQHPNVRAFHTAPRSWGRDGALLVLLRLAKGSVAAKDSDNPA